MDTLIVRRGNKTAAAKRNPSAQESRQNIIGRAASGTAAKNQVPPWQVEARREDEEDQQSRSGNEERRRQSSPA